MWERLTVHYERTAEHAWSDKSSIVNQHIKQCDQFQHIFNKFHVLEDREVDVIKKYSKEIIRQNTVILDEDRNWNLLLHKEALYISRLKPPLNNGLRASREPVLFR